VKLFVSFNKADLEFASWIAWTTERSGCDVVFQEWDFAAGTDFVEQMRRGLADCDKLIAVLSPAYLDALYTHPEWHEFFRRDPTGEKGLLLLLRVAECDLGPLLNTRVHVDLFGCSKREARNRLLTVLRGERRKPKREPLFPEPSFPLTATPPVAGPREDLADWRVDGRNGFEVLTDLYHLARQRSDDLLQLEADADGWQRYLNLRDVAAKALSVNSRPSIRMKQSLPSLDDDPAALAAALYATAVACQPKLRQGPRSIQTSDALGRVEYRVTQDDSPFDGDFPRHAEELSATIESLFLLDIRLIPAESAGFRLLPVELTRATRARLEDCRKRREIRIGLSSLGGGAELVGEAVSGFPAGERCRFRLTELRNGDAESENLVATLSAAAREGAAILVLPELRVTPAMEGAAREFLAKGGHSLALVIAGSWHYAAGDNEWENRCTVLGARGETLWQHRKLREYRATEENVAAAAEFFARIGVDENGGSEAILRGRTLEYCDTPVGRLCVAICVGFFHPDVQPALMATRADYFLVPAMTPSAVDLHRTADQLARIWAATLVANCGVVGQGKAPCFWRKPLRNEVVRKADADLSFVDFILS
jgi:predicted amidohydrolase